MSKRRRPRQNARVQARPAAAPPAPARQRAKPRAAARRPSGRSPAVRIALLAGLAAGAAVIVGLAACGSRVTLTCGTRTSTADMRRTSSTARFPTGTSRSSTHPERSCRSSWRRSSPRSRPASTPRSGGDGVCWPSRRCSSCSRSRLWGLDPPGLPVPRRPVGRHPAPGAVPDDALHFYVAALTLAATCAILYRRRYLGAALLGVSISTKLYPAVLLPLLVIGPTGSKGGRLHAGARPDRGRCGARLPSVRGGGAGGGVARSIWRPGRTGRCRSRASAPGCSSRSMTHRDAACLGKQRRVAGPHRARWRR